MRSPSLLRLAATLCLVAAGAPSRAQDAGAGPSATLGEVVFLGEAHEVQPAQIVESFQRRIAPLRQCYARALGDSPSLGGEMQVDVTFARNGRVTAAAATGLGSVPAVSQCVAGVARGMTFPRLRPREALSVRFLLPITFRRN